MSSLIRYIDNIIANDKTRRRENLAKNIVRDILSRIFDTGEKHVVYNDNFQHHHDNEMKEFKRLIVENADILHGYIADIKSSENRREKNTIIIEQPNHKKHYTIKIVGKSDQGYSLALILSDNSKHFALIIARTLQILIDKFEGWKIKE